MGRGSGGLHPCGWNALLALQKAKTSSQLNGMSHAQQKSRWTELAADTDTFGRFLSFVRDQHVKSIELDGIKIEFQSATYVSTGTPQADRFPELTEEQKKKEEEDLLFHSSG
jgi:hypothetical protein